MSTQQATSSSVASENSLANCNFKYNNCLAIRQEIQRFESVHPSIYAIYDLLELNSDQVLSLRIREHLLSIEDSFVNSQEWTLSRNVPDLRLGIVGSLSSGKSALVHRYLTGSYMQDESPEGGRFKKEIFIQGQSNMLLIRDEGGPPEMQFSCWVDAIIFVFSVDSLESFETVRKYYQKLLAFRPNLDHIPLILVGTKDNVNDSNVRVIDEYAGRKLAADMRRHCVYYETCATYGLNVEQVFQDACQRIIQSRKLLPCQPSSNPSPTLLSTTVSSSGQSLYHPYNNLSRPTTPNNNSSTVSTVTVGNGNLTTSNSSNNSLSQNYFNITNNNYLNSNFNGAPSNRNAASNLSTFTANYQAAYGSAAGSSQTGMFPASKNSSNNNNLLSAANNSLIINKKKSALPSKPNVANTSLTSGQPSNEMNRNSPSPLEPTRISVSNITVGATLKPSNEHVFINPAQISGPVPPKRFESKQQQTNVASGQDSSTSMPVFTPISTIKEALQQNSTNPNVLPICTQQVQILPTQFAKCSQQVSHSNGSNNNNSITSTSTPINLPTPSCTPNVNRKTRRRSNLFSVSSSKNKNLEEKCRNGELGSGRAIPLRQGYLHKKSINSALNTKLSLKNKEWKKKYVTLTTDGCLTYHPSLHDYMSDTHGKKINLMHTTVKIPGQKPRGSSVISQNTQLPFVNNAMENEFNKLNLISNLGNESAVDCGPINDGVKCVNCGCFLSLDERKMIPNTNPNLKDKEKDSSKKKHRRMKSTQINASLQNGYCEKCINLLDLNTSNNGQLGSTEEEDFVFVIVSLDNKQWHFQAQSAEDRENWLQAIENQILLSLQNIQSDKEKSRNGNIEQQNKEKMVRDQIKQIPGNSYCLDCDAANPTWASLNLGGLMCIECSGIHRNLGTHISKVRSLDLDDWPQGNVAVMMALGNTAVNKIWEYNTKNLSKPVPTSIRDEKEKWIRMKYERKDFLCPLTSHLPFESQLENAINSNDTNKIALLLAHSNSNGNEIRFGENKRTPLQLATCLNNIANAQLFIWYIGNINAQDALGNNALSFASSKEMQDLLKSQGCSECSLNVSSNSHYLVNSDSRCSYSKDQISNIVPADVFDQLPTSII